MDFVTMGIIQVDVLEGMLFYFLCRRFRTSLRSRLTFSLVSIRNLQDYFCTNELINCLAKQYLINLFMTDHRVIQYRVNQYVSSLLFFHHCVLKNVVDLFFTLTGLRLLKSTCVHAVNDYVSCPDPNTACFVAFSP